MLKVLRGIARHPKLFHNSLGTSIDRSGERNNLTQSKHFKRMTQDRSAALCRQPLPPHIGRKPPSDFHAGHESSLKCRGVNADESDELLVPSQFCGVEAKAVIPELRLNVIAKVITLLTRQDSRLELHYVGIRIEPRKWFAVLISPTAQDHPLGRYDDHVAVRSQEFP